MTGPAFGPVEEEIAWPDQVAPQRGKGSSTRNLKSRKPQNLNVRSRVVCARCPRLRAIWNGYTNPPRIAWVPLYPFLWMGEPWVVQYRVCCLLSFFVYDFSAKGKIG